jgi:PAS domain S-box-containing protein
MDFIPKPVNEVELYGRVNSAVLLYLERIHNRQKTAALLESQQRYELAVSGVNDGIWDMNLVTNQIYYSPQWKANLGYQDNEWPNVMGTWEDLIHPEDKERALATIHEHWQQKTAFYTSEHRLKTKAGSYKWVFSRGRAIWDDHGKVVRMAGSTTDITQRRNLEQQLHQSHQLESIGRLAAGIAHDFNNLLTAILGHATFMQLHVPGSGLLRTGLDHIEKAASRAAELCKQMLAYAGKGEYSVEPVDVNALIKETVDLLQISISKKIRLDLSLASQPLVVKADVTQIRQVLMNLVLNAAEAIGDESGAIKITTSESRPTAAEMAGAVLAPNTPGASYVQIEVNDSGGGMNRETIGKIFEPFFTTKFAGRGLGLSAVLGIIKAHNGVLKVNSQLGSGTHFQILIPRVDAPAG